MFDPVRICQVLDEEGVEFVIVGGFAAVIHGSSLPTRDIDIVPSRSSENLERLARALERLGAMLRTDADPVATRLDAALHEQRSVEQAAEDLEHLRDLGRPSPAARAVSTGP